jgi:hypothetical protein
MICKIRTCVHCSRTTEQVEFSVRKRARNSGTYMQIQNICITCYRELNRMKSIRHYENNRDAVNLRRKKRRVLMANYTTNDVSSINVV